MNPRTSPSRYPLSMLNKASKIMLIASDNQETCGHVCYERLKWEDKQASLIPNKTRLKVAQLPMFFLSYRASSSIGYSRTRMVCYLMAGSFPKTCSSIRTLLTPCTSIKMVSRGAAGKWREDNGLPPRFAGGPLRDLPEYSFVDGRGPGPLSRQQARRVETNKIWAKTIIKHMQQFQIGKELVPEDTKRIE